MKKIYLLISLILIIGILCGCVSQGNAGDSSSLESSSSISKPFNSIENDTRNDKSDVNHEITNQEPQYTITEEDIRSFLGIIFSVDYNPIFMTEKKNIANWYSIQTYLFPIYNTAMEGKEKLSVFGSVDSSGNAYYYDGSDNEYKPLPISELPETVIKEIRTLVNNDGSSRQWIIIQYSDIQRGADYMFGAGQVNPDDYICWDEGTFSDDGLLFQEMPGTDFHNIDLWKYNITDIEYNGNEATVTYTCYCLSYSISGGYYFDDPHQYGLLTDWMPIDIPEKEYGNFDYIRQQAEHIFAQSNFTNLVPVKVVFFKDDTGVHVKGYGETVIGTAKVLVDGLNKRSGPNTDANIWDVVKKGDVFQVYNQKNDGRYTWYKIGITSWIANDGTWVEFSPTE